jgi:hypothetical protein
MKNNQATHNHKRVGAVVILQSTAELAQIVTSASDTFWVKLTDLTELADDRTENLGKRRLGTRVKSAH